MWAEGASLAPALTDVKEWNRGGARRLGVPRDAHLCHQRARLRAPRHGQMSGRRFRALPCAGRIVSVCDFGFFKSVGT